MTSFNWLVGIIKIFKDVFMNLVKSFFKFYISSGKENWKNLYELLYDQICIVIMNS